MHRERLTAKEIKQQLTSPVLKTVFGYRQMIEKERTPFHEYDDVICKTGKEFLDLEIQKNKLKEISRLGNFDTLTEFSLVELSHMDRRGKFETLSHLRKLAHTGEKLIEIANEYLYIKRQLAANNLPDTWLDGEITPSMYDRFSNNYDNEQDLLPDFIFNKKLDDPVTAVAAINESKTFTGIKAEAASFAVYQESILTILRYEKVAWVSAKEVGFDFITGEPAIFVSDTYEELQRRTRRLPEGLEGWMERSLMGYQGSAEHYGLYNEETVFQEIVETVLPNGMNNPSVKAYLAAEQQRKQLPKSENGDREYDQHHLQAWNRSCQRLLAVKRNMFDESLMVFSQATELLHPDVEDQARKLAVFAIRTGSHPFFFDNYSELKKEAGKPLAAFITRFKQIAYKEGVYLDPLKQKMEEVIQQEMVDPQHVANKIEEALIDRQNLRQPRTDLTATEKWFVEESLQTVSTLDHEGKYTQKGGWFSQKRSSEVVADIIAYLRSLKKAS